MSFDMPYPDSTDSMSDMTTTGKAKSAINGALTQIKSFLFSRTCPIASGILWLSIFISLYYGIIMPDSRISAAEKGIQVTKLNGNVRAILAFTWLVGGIFAFFIVRWTCMREESNLAQLIYGLVALGLIWFLSIIVLWIANKNNAVSIQSSAEFVNFLNKQNTCS